MYYKEIIDWVDLILVPLYFGAMLLLLLWIKKKNPNNELIQKYLIKGFIFKVICAIAYAFLLEFYYQFGDSLSYFKDAIYLQSLIREGKESWNVMFVDAMYLRETHGMIASSTEGNWVVVRLALLLSYVSFYRYLVVTLFFSLIAYSGMFKMLEAFAALMPQWHKRIALIILFFPSISIYGSGVLKDTICMAALGWLVYYSHLLFIKKGAGKKFKHFFLLVLCGLIIGVVKIYIIAAFIVCYLFYLILLLVRKIQSSFIRRIVLPIILLFTVSIYLLNSKEIDSWLGIYAGETLFKTIKTQQQEYLKIEDAELGAVFDLGDFEPTLGGFIKMMPGGINATLFRPYLWESKKPIMLFSALESLFILLFTLYVIYKAGIIGFLKEIIRNPFIFFCLIFSILFAAMIGLSTFNFGTLGRYRIPIIPFYLIGLMAILYQVKDIRQKRLQEKPA